MSEKYFICPEQLLLESYQLGQKVLESDFRPNFLIALWRGGTPVGIALQEFLSYHGVQTDHISVRTSHYEDVEQKQKIIRVHGLEYLVRHANANDRLLIVDDVWDTGLSVQAVIQQIQQKARRNTPEQIKIATLYFKPQNNETGLNPDFYLTETNRWLVFPHELKGLTIEEIRKSKGEEIYRFLQGTKEQD